MIQRNKKQIIITTLVMLIPVLAGVLLWGKLPDTIPTHFDGNGVANGFSSKAGTVFGVFLPLVGVHLLCAFVTAYDPRRKNISDRIYRRILWICPLISGICAVSIYGSALGYEKVNTPIVVNIFVSIIFIVVGNYLPKCRQNYTVGIKLPWTLSSQENWDATHRMAGKLWMLGGVAMFATAFLKGMNQVIVICVITGVIVLIPTIYSFVFYLKNSR